MAVFLPPRLVARHADQPMSPMINRKAIAGTHVARFSAIICAGHGIRR
jgi:hypothetical protein